MYKKLEHTVYFLSNQILLLVNCFPNGSLHFLWATTASSDYAIDN